MLRLLIQSTRHAVAIRAAVRVLKQGGVIAFPTETTYGLGCDPRNARAVAKIFSIKGREKQKPLLLVGAGMSDVRRVARRSSHVRALASRYWPGPLTLVLPSRASARLANAVAPRGEVAIRVSASPLVRALVAAYGFPIIATSANRSGESDSRSGRAVVRAFDGRRHAPDLLLDIGALPRRKPSTVARVRPDGTVEVLRSGSVRM